MIETLLGRGGQLEQDLPGYEPRPQQIAMAEAVLGALEQERAVVVEAGTGVGKTLGYLIPALLSGRKVLVSTGTKTLQEQIYTKDLPLLRKLLPKPFTAAYMKGIGNYLCLRRFAEADIDSPMLRAWARTTKTGDRAELVELSDADPVWRSIQSTPETRLGARCRFFEDCFVTRMRRQAAEADLVIVNHHLFFADLAVRALWPQAQVVPPYEAAIFDEAHGLEEVATEYFGVQVSSHRLTALARELRRRHVDAFLASRVQSAGESLLGRVATRLGAEAHARLPPELWTGDLLAEYHTLDNVLDEVAAHVGQSPDDEVAALAHRTEALRADLALLTGQTRRDLVYWAERSSGGVWLRGSPVEIGPILRETLLAQVPSLVFTSATLSVGGSFDYFSQSLGLDGRQDTAYLSLDSPFDYAKQSMLYVPRDLPEPQEPGFIDQATERMRALLELTGGRAFLLFTSYRNLRAAEQRLRASGLRYPLLVQGERPRGVLLDTFRQTIGSVLLATSSFWEGVDVPGEALQLVVIDKLPFAPPDDPIGTARTDRLRELGRDPFRAYQLPRAALALKQGFGRLIRHRGDRGIVAVLDKRIVTKGYGKVLLRSLPAACPLSGELEQVETWWRS